MTYHTAHIMVHDKLLTITDEAFIHLCIINYSATWKAQEQKKSGETDVQVPVSNTRVGLWLLYWPETE